MAVSRRLALGVSAALLTATVTLVGANEGWRLRAYRDPTGIPTICAGLTQGVTMGEVRTPQQCAQMTAAEVIQSLQVVRGALKHAQPDERVSALGDFEFNVGQAAFLHSNVLREINAGHIRAGCNDLLQWDHADGEVLPGLTTRRQHERMLCLKGLD